jgi:hypothetical protein
MRYKVLSFLIVAAMLLIPLAALAQDEAPASPAPAQAAPTPSIAEAYTIFVSPPEKLDALFAAFMDAIPYESLEDYAAKNPTATYTEFLYGIDLMPSLPALKALQSRFGDMPEYWQMMYAFGEGTRKERNVYLDKAYHLFLYDPATVYFYALFSMMPGGENGDGYYNLTPETFRRLRDTTALLAHAAEMDGRNSFYWYETAYIASLCSGVEEVLGYIRRGNECPVNEYLEPFPFSYIARHREELPARYPGKYLLLQPMDFSERLRSLIGYKAMIRNIITGVNLSGELGWLTDVHRMGCRFGMMSNAPQVVILVGGVFSAMMSKEAIDLGFAPETVEEVNGFALYQYRRGQIFGSFKSFSNSGHDKLMKKLGLDYMSLDALSMSDPRAAEYVRADWEQDSDFAVFVFPNICSHYQRLITFDFAKPGTYIDRPWTSDNVPQSGETE